MDRNPVLQALIHRWRTGSVPGQRRDGLKIGLAIEGGAMRGVVSAGMLAALEYLGLLPAFDVVYGSSGGAINGAYFVSAQAGSGAAIYYENINNSRFISPLRFLCGGPLLSLNFLFEQAMTREKPLDWHKVVQSPIELVPVGTSVKTGKAVLLRGARSRESLFQRLKASAQIPFVASPPIRVADEEFFDGGLTAPIPVQPALEEGCTHVLALLTLPAGARPTPGSFLGRYFIARRMAKYSPELRTAFLRQADHYGRDLDWLNDITGRPGRAPYICAIRPSQGARAVSRFENSWKRLVSGARSGAEPILEAFGQPKAFWPRVLLPQWVRFFKAMNSHARGHSTTAMIANEPEMVSRRAG